MKRFLIRVAIFFAVVIVADFIFGKVMFYAEKHSSSKNYHCMYEADEDILILGSSYAVRDIVPSIIEDSLGISCYNAGEAGNGSIVAWARYNMYIKQHTPKLIIYTLTPEYDYIKSDDYSKYLNTIKTYYGHEESIAKIYNDLMNWSDRLILTSNFVKFNSYGAQLIYYFLSKKYMGLQGYEPLYETFTPYEIKEEQTVKKYEIDAPKMAYLEKLFEIYSVEATLKFVSTSDGVMIVRPNDDYYGSDFAKIMRVVDMLNEQGFIRLDFVDYDDCSNLALRI